jgi:hypothetical protein
VNLTVEQLRAIVTFLDRRGFDQANVNTVASVAYAKPPNENLRLKVLIDGTWEAQEFNEIWEECS